MALTFFWGVTTNSATLQSLGTTDFSNGDTTGTGQGSPVFSTDGLSGSYAFGAGANTQAGYGFASNSGGSFYTGTIDNVTQATDLVCSFGFNFYAANAAPATTTNRQLGFQVKSVSTERIQVVLTNAGKLAIEFTHGGSTQVYCTTTTGFAADQWYGVVGRIDIPNNKAKLEVYTHSGSHGSALTLVESVEDTSSGKDAVAPILDPTASSGTTFTAAAGVHTTDPLYFDNLFIANTYDEPIQNNLTISAYSSYLANTPKRIVPVNFIAAQSSSVAGA